MTVWVMVDNGFIESYDAFKTIILMTRVTCQMLQWGYKFSHRHIWIWMCTLPITLWNLLRNNAKYYNIFPTKWWYLLAGLSFMCNFLISVPHCRLVVWKVLWQPIFPFEKLVMAMVPKWRFLHILNDSRWFRTFFFLKQLLRVSDI